MPETNTHTEEAARTNWCPLARVGVDWRVNGEVTHFPGNRNNDGEPVGVCIASVCMMWRWAGTDKRAGYCGLAGNQIITA